MIERRKAKTHTTKIPSKNRSVHGQTVAATERATVLQ